MISAAKRVERNDRTLTHLLLCEPPTVVRRQGAGFDMTYISDDRPALAALCDGIGDNEHLEDVCFDAPLGLADRAADGGDDGAPSCFGGLRRNASIRSLGLSRCDLSRGVGREVLAAFGENPERLEKFAVWRCGMGRGGTSNLASTLISCRHLREISLSSCHVDDACVRVIVAAIREHHHLNKLDLRDNCIGGDGCKDLSTLLRKPNCKRLRLVDLGDNNIDDAGAKFLANGLRDNDVLEALCLEENAIISKGWDALSTALCDTSSLNATHSSNHTLRMIASYGHVSLPGGGLYDEDDVMPRSLLRLVDWNGRGRSNKSVARRKVLRSHFVDAFRMAPFLEENMDRNVLPHVLHWIGRSSDAASLAAMTTLVRELPGLCAAAGDAEGRGSRRSVAGASHGSALGAIVRGTLGRPRALGMLREMAHLFRAQPGDRN